MNLKQARHLNVTPLDIRQASFKSAMRGFNRDEVTTFIRDVANDYENALRENDRLRQDLVRLDAVLNQHRDLEGSLKNTLMTVQKAFDDVRETSNLEGERIVREAESSAEITLQKAQARLENIQREISNLKLKRREAETTIEATISSLRHTLEFVREEEERTRPVVPTEDAPTNGHRHVDAISATAESATIFMRPASGPGVSVRETTDGVAALDKPRPSRLPPGVDVPGPESDVQETTDGGAALDKANTVLAPA